MTTTTTRSTASRPLPDPLDPANVLPVLVAERAGSDPDHPLLIDIGRATTTYSELHQRVLAWINAFRDLGIDRGDRVVTMSRPSAEATALWLACGWAGVLEVPINVAFKGRILQHVLNDADADVAVVQPEFLERMLDDSDGIECLRRAIVVTGPTVPAHEGSRLAATLLAGDELLAGVGRQPAAGPTPQPWDVSTVLYTSGTTGPSKGVLVPFGQIATALEAFDDCGPGDRLFAPFEPSHLAGKIPVQLMAYWQGSHVFREGFKTGEFWNDVHVHQCNRVWLFHSMANFVWREPHRADDADNPIETITGGPLLHEYREFEERFRVKMRTNFGMTEAGWPIITGDDVRNHLSCGRPRAGYDLRIVDENDLEVQPGAVGELLIRSDLPWTMNLGYFRRPEQTAAAWRNGWFHTGDAFRVDQDGSWYFVDRIKDAIRRRGENVSSFEVESLVGEHPAVLECAAVGVPSEHGEEEIKICVVCKPGNTLSPEELLEFLDPRMPSFMVPRYVEILDTLPKTPTGKVRKVELKARPLDATWDSRRGERDRGATR